MNRHTITSASSASSSKVSPASSTSNPGSYPKRRHVRFDESEVVVEAVNVERCKAYNQKGPRPTRAEVDEELDFLSSTATERLERRETKINTERNRKVRRRDAMYVTRTDEGYMCSPIQPFGGFLIEDIGDFVEPSPQNKEAIGNVSRGFTEEDVGRTIGELPAEESKVEGKLGNTATEERKDSVDATKISTDVAGSGKSSAATLKAGPADSGNMWLTRPCKLSAPESRTGDSLKISDPLPTPDLDVDAPTDSPRETSNSRTCF
ncbi:hypothetical protein BDY19DRAFT_990958 [Irpex rosettiformis]|uniref:Uncharacterized protein n=1 Tax=Irpex rosettiformis TaxID=378272 RepID=A0ACB8UD31_9APHY|nr:hypothetical protein BDY19DRAFT_990958 [Irpex rosettiformis]